MRIGLHYSTFSHAGWQTSLTRTLTETARTADEGGVSLFSVMDHWFQMEFRGGPAEPMLEGYTTLGYLAGVSSRMRLGLLVTGVTYRHPGLLAKTVTTLDVLSGGRAVLGIGAAWYGREHEGLGVPFPPLSERFERLEETLKIALRMWDEDESPYSGAHYQLAEPVNVPPAVQRPHPPILIGGTGEQKTLRLVAQYADACNLLVPDVETARHKLEVLRRHCDDLGRDFDSIEKTVLSRMDPVASPDEFLAAMEDYSALGVDLVTMTPNEDDPVGWTEKVCTDIVPRLESV